MTVAERSPIFIVGASRSGTALMRSVMNNHPEVFISGETHYFDDLRLRMPGSEDSPLRLEDAKRCEDYFLALAHRPYGHAGDPAKARIGRDELRSMAWNLGPGLDAYFEAFCILRARREGKTIWGEKTPRHVFRIPEIVQRFPNGRILCMVRDARAVVASYRDWRNQGGFDVEHDPTHADALRLEETRARNSYNILLATLLWKSTVQAARRAQARFGLECVRVQHYESLVQDAHSTVKSICDWARLDFDRGMLDVPVLNSSVAPFREHAGITGEALHRWRKRLSPREIDIIQRTAGRLMLTLGYVPEPVSSAALAYALEWVKVPFAALRAGMVNRKRIANIRSYVWRRLSLVVARN